MTKKEKQITIFRLVYRNDKPSTTGRHYPVSHRIPSIDEVYDEATKRNRKIQYVLGEQSIIAQGTPNEIMKSSKAIKLYFGTPYNS